MLVLIFAGFVEVDGFDAVDRFAEVVDFVVIGFGTVGFVDRFNNKLAIKT